MVRSLGGDITASLPKAPVQMPCRAPRGGVVERVDVKALGMAIVELGGGRRQPSEAIDHAVGLSEVIERGKTVDAGDPLAIIHARSQRDAEQVGAALQVAFTLSDLPESQPGPVVLDRVRSR